MSRSKSIASAPVMDELELSRARDGLSRWLRRKGVAVDEADDLAQSACLRALQSAEGARPGLPLLPWLVTIARRLLIDRARRSERATPRARRESPGSDPLERATRSEDVRRLHAAVDRLDEDSRRLVTLFYSEGLGTAEISARLGIARGTVKSRLHRARQEIAASFMIPGDRP